MLRAWRQAGHDIPVLILTARDALEQRLCGLQNGADDYLCKPFALRYTPVGGRVTVTLNEGQLQVADNGPGVSVEQLARLGERFYRPPGRG